MRIAVVGGGVVGLISAYQLVRSGHEVTVFEKHRIGAGASTGNACLVNPGSSFPVPAPGGFSQAVRSFGGGTALLIRPHLRPSYVRFLLGMARASNQRVFDRQTDAYSWLGREALAAFDRLDDTGLEYERHNRGLAEVFTERDQRDRYLQQYQRVSWMAPKVRAVEGNELATLEPALADVYRFGVWTQEARQVNPTSLMQALRDAIVTAGGAVREETAVRRLLRSSSGQVSGVSTSSGEFTADRVVIAAGYTSPELTRALGLRLCMEGGKGYSVDYVAPGHGIVGTVILEDSHLALSVFDDRLRVTSFMEFGGDSAVKDRAISYITSHFEQAFPGVDSSQHTAGWAGFRPMAPDGMPVIGSVPGAPEVILATGHAMLGLSLGAITGEVIRDFVDGTLDEASIPKEFSPGRFA